MVIIRRIIFIIVLLGLAFVFYRFLNPEGADNLIAKLRGTSISSTISDIQNLVSSGKVLSGEIDTGVITTGVVNTGIILTGKTFTGILETGLIQTGVNKTGFQASGETIGLVDNMDGFSEIIDSTASEKAIKGDLKYINSDYKFSISFPGSWDGYTIQINTGKDIKSEFIFSFDKKDYFIIYVISNNYYNDNISSKFSYLTYLAQDTNNTFAYKILENTDSTSKAIPYILKTFRVTDSITTTNSGKIIVPTTNTVVSKPATTKKIYSSDSNYIKNIWNSFIK